MSRYPLNLPKQLKSEAERWAQQQGVSLNQFILWATAEKVGALNQQLDDPNFPQITYRRGASGTPTAVIRGTGVRVQAIAIAHHDWSMAAADIAAQYSLSIKQVESALAFYEAHRAEIDSHILREAQTAQAANE